MGFLSRMLFVIFDFSILMFYTVGMKTSKPKQKVETDSKWQTTPVANRVRNAASGIYYARVRIRGKLIWKSLKTDIMSVAKLRLGDFLKEENHRAEATQANVRGKMAFRDALTIYRQQLQNAQHLKPAAKIYRERSI